MANRAHRGPARDIRSHPIGTGPFKFVGLYAIQTSAAAMGHEAQFPPPEASARYRFGEGTFAGTRGNERDAPIPDLASTAIRSVGVGTQGRNTACWRAILRPKGSQREETPMLRRDLLKAGIGAAAALAAPCIGGAAAAKTLAVAPTGDLVVLDPVVTFNRLRLSGV
jgi:hypothetical protein